MDERTVKKLVGAAMLLAVAYQAYSYQRLAPKPPAPEETKAAESIDPLVVDLGTASVKEIGEVAFYDFREPLNGVEKLEEVSGTVFAAVENGIFEFKPGDKGKIYRRSKMLQRSRTVDFSAGDQFVLAAEGVYSGQSNYIEPGIFALNRGTGAWSRISEQPGRSVAAGKKFFVLGRKNELSEFAVEVDKLSFNTTRQLSLRQCDSIATRVVGEDLWFVQGGSCGLNKVSLTSGETKSFFLPSGTAARDMAADSSNVYVSLERAHGGELLGLFVLDVAKGQGRHIERGANGGYLSAITLGISRRAVWVGTGDGGNPFIRADKKDLSGWIVQGYPKDRWIRAISSGPDGVWFAACKDIYQPYFSNTCRLGYVKDAEGQPEKIVGG